MYVHKRYNKQQWLLSMLKAKVSVDYAEHPFPAQLRASVDVCMANSFCCCTIYISRRLCLVNITQCCFFVKLMTM